MSNERPDLGFGDARAPAGTEPWAKRWRVEFYAAVQQLDQYPKSIQSFVDVGERFRAWSLLKDSNGHSFATFDAFCEAPNPHGLGVPAEKIRAVLIQLHGKRAVQLAAVPVDGRVDNRRGGKDETHPGGENHRSPGHEQRLRAILRAPAEVQQWYRDEVISQKVAAKLGPSKQTPEQAARIREIVNAVETFVQPKEHDRVTKKQVDATVRRMLGEHAVDKVEKLLRLYSKLTTKQREMFLSSAMSMKS